MQRFGGAVAPKPAANDAVIKDGDIASFGRDVIQASQTTPVLVDFWAPWCGPCKQLTPVLEKVVRAAGGKVKLVKINIDDNPELAQQLRIQSVPTVYAFLGGQPVTGFQGAQPESQIKALIDRLIGAAGGAAGEPEQVGIEEAQAALEAGDAETAIAIFQEILAEDPANAEAIAGLARTLLGLGQIAEAKEVLETTPKEQAGHAAISGARAAVGLAEEAGQLGDPQALQARLQRDDLDHDARYRLATLLFLRGQVEPAIEQLITIIRRERGWNDDQARRQLLKFFEALGPKSPATLKGRRMLSSVLFS